MAKKAGRKSTKATFIFSHKIFFLFFLTFSCVIFCFDVVAVAGRRCRILHMSECNMLCFTFFFSAPSVRIFYFRFWSLLSSSYIGPLLPHAHTQMHTLFLLKKISLWREIHYNNRNVWFLGRWRVAQCRQQHDLQLNNTYWIISDRKNKN